jgi:hypothetical protein
MIRGRRRLERLERRQPAEDDLSGLSEEELEARIDAILIPLVAESGFDELRARVARELDPICLEMLDARKAAGVLG